MKIGNLVMGAAFAALLSGCGSANEASTGNFKRVIDEHYARKCILIRPDGGIGVDSSSFPVTVELRTSGRKDARDLDERAQREFDAFVGIGLLEVEDTMVTPSGWGVSPAKQVPAKRYSLTETGEKIYQAGEKHSPTGFCAGHYQVDEIKRFSEPGAMGPYTISEVAYVYSPKNLPEWAADPNLLQAMPELKKTLQVGRDGKATLIKTNEGWVHERDFND